MNSPLNAVVTGATGFLGSALVHKLLKSGGQVATIVRKGSSNCFRLPSHPNLIQIYGDLDNVKAWSKDLSEFSADVFYHLAWQGVGNTLRNDPIQIINIEPTLDTLKLAKEIGCKRWIGIGSQAEYGSLNRRISEKDITEPTTLYGAAKLSACLLTQVLAKQIEIEAVWVRVFSTYGPGDNSGWMLIDVINKILRGQRPALTRGEQLWDYLYVDDAVDALECLGIVDNLSGIYNLGSGQSQTIRSIVEMVRDMINPEFSLIFGEVPYRPDQVMHLEANIDKMNQDTGWYPRIKLAVGIRNLIESIKTTQL